jgi:hypothetical protein
VINFVLKKTLESIAKYSDGNINFLHKLKKLSSTAGPHSIIDVVNLFWQF